RRHTRSKRDWSSDVCSSDLVSPTRKFAGVLTTWGPCTNSYLIRRALISLTSPVSVSALSFLIRKLRRKKLPEFLQLEHYATLWKKHKQRAAYCTGGSKAVLYRWGMLNRRKSSQTVPQPPLTPMVLMA